MVELTTIKKGTIMNMNQNILDALKAKINKEKPVQRDMTKLSQDKPVTYTPQTPKTIDLNNNVLIPDLDYIDQVIIRNRLDVYFKACPSESFRTILKSQQWRYNPDRVCWYHANTQENRDFLIKYYPILKSQFSELNEVIKKDDDNDTPQDYVSDSYKEYTQKIDQLCERLNIEKSDLLLKAINTLFDLTFKSN